MTLRTRLAAAAVAWSLAGCGGDPIQPPNLVPVASVTVEPANPAVGVNATAPLTAIPKDVDGTPLPNRAVTWESSDPGVATVSATGVVTGVAAGTTTITAASEGKMGSVTLTVSAVPVASATVTPANGAVEQGGTLTLTGTARDAADAPLPGRVFAWTSSAPAVATVDHLGVVRGVAAGTAIVTGTSEGQSATATIQVVAPAVASVTIAPENPVVGLGAEVTLTATPRDADGDPLSGRTVVWSTSNNAVATVSAAGVVRGVAPGEATITATVDGASGTTTASVRLRFTAVSAGRDFTCGVTPVGTAYCWGRNATGSLGTGALADLNTPGAVVMPAGVSFDSVSAGADHACALARDGAIYCWGANTFGQLGTGTTSASSVPVKAATPAGVAFTTVSAAAQYTCARATTNVVYCWGLNARGQLGNANNVGFSTPTPFPLAVPAGPFVAVAATERHTCALENINFIWCWGDNSSAQLGRGGGATNDFNPNPERIFGSFRFTTVTAGVAFACGVQTDNTAWCWGRNADGELGTSTRFDFSSVPVAVEGGLAFRTVSAGQALACGVTTGSVGYCWGANDFGQLGIGSTSPEVQPPGPRRLSGNLVLAAIDAGYAHACAVTTDRRAFCWGRAQDGTHPNASALGKGTAGSSNVPVEVSGG